LEVIRILKPDPDSDWDSGSGLRIRLGRGMRSPRALVSTLLTRIIVVEVVSRLYFLSLVSLVVNTVVIDRLKRPVPEMTCDNGMVCVNI